MFWDGGYLGNFTQNIIKRRYLLYPNKDVYWTIDINGWLLECISVPVIDGFSCIIDQIKPLFGLNSRGTNSLHIEYKLYVIYCVIVEQRTIIWDTPLSTIRKGCYPRNELVIRDQVRSILIFHDMLQLDNRSSLAESTILIRCCRNNVYAISRYEEKTYLNKQTLTNKERALSGQNNIRWFGNISYSDVTLEWLRNIAKINHIRLTDDTLVNVFSILKSEIEVIIDRIDHEYCWYSNHIINKLMGYIDIEKLR